MLLLSTKSYVFELLLSLKVYVELFATFNQRTPFHGTYIYISLLEGFVGWKCHNLLGGNVIICN